MNESSGDIADGGTDTKDDDDDFMVLYLLSSAWMVDLV